MHKLRVSVAHVAKYGKVSRNTIYLILDGTTKDPSLPTVRKLAKGLSADLHTGEQDPGIYRAALDQLTRAAGLETTLEALPPVTLDSVLNEHMRVPGAASAMAEWIRTHPDATPDQVRMLMRLASALEDEHRRN